MEHETGRETRASYIELSLDEVLPTSMNEVMGATQSVSGSVEHAESTAKIPETLGRYSVLSLLGEGGYGRVFKAFDDQLQRHVAIKVPHVYRITSAASVEKYLEEARTLAKMEHPGIVGVHDVGVTDDGLPYIVSAFIDGTNLAKRMASKPFTLRQGIELLVEVGAALGYVHAQGIVHRDVKPGNILLNRDGKPFLADFGLALRDELTDPTRTRVGTPAYMSPEQARGESHLVDGRSDVFSLGSVLYEMLTGSRPFRGRDRDSTVYKLLNKEPSPPRQHNASLPRDLDRICLKALAKRASHRYSTAGDFVEDLKFFLDAYEGNSVGQSAQESTPVVAESGHFSGVIPRGLRSYDRHDASFFCRLLPGPRDRQWVPESIRFWQRQVEGADVAEPPRVGVLYGPSGCGKSSFVKAGLLPLLGGSVTSVFVEATRDDTESRLLRGIRRKSPDAKPGATLTETLAKIRSDNEDSGSGRLLIVIDQFEQWLHGRADESDPELATALRQCDGHHVQCLLLIRDDFWLSLSRFMAMLEVPLKQNYNASLVDLFSARHARRVLAELGVAYDRLPADVKQFSNEQNEFLDIAAEQLSESGKVFPVRLSLFVEMIKSQTWDTATLTKVGGVKGLGLQFLEDSFSSDLAPVAQRTHEPAVRQVLRALLPDHGVDIKGKMQSEPLLLERSGYKDQPEQFDQVMRILDTDLRMVTPTDPSGTTTSDDSYSQSGDGTRYYQLTHDFLVPAIEQWLTRRQRETRKGRAELRLAEYASLWSAKPLAKFAPSWADWLLIRLWSSQEYWNAGEREMMRAAGRRHILRTLGVVAVLGGLTAAGMTYRSRANASALVQQLQVARTDDLSETLTKLRGSHTHAIRLLKQHLDAAESGSRAEVVNRLALLSNDPTQSRILIRKSLELDFPLLLVLREELSPLSVEDQSYLNQVLGDENHSAAEKLRAAAMLGESAANHSSIGQNPVDEASAEEQLVGEWPAEQIVEELLRHAKVSPQEHSSLVDALFPVSEKFMLPLMTVALQSFESQRRSLATSFVAQFLRDNPDGLLDFFLDVDASQHESVLPLLDPQLKGLSDRIRSIAFSEMDTALPEPEYDVMAKRKGTATALLHRVGDGRSTWSALKHSSMPHVRSYFLHRMAPLGGDFEATLSRFSREPEVSIRRGLLMALGRFAFDRIPESLRLEAISQAKDAFENDPDSGVHSAAMWALTRWGQDAWIKDATTTLARSKADPRKHWYVTGEGQTMAVFDARDVEGIGRVFEISMMEVTVEQFLRFRPHHPYYEFRSPMKECPVGLLDWFDAVSYCRWLSRELDSDHERGYPSALSRDSPDVGYDDVIEGGAYRLPTAEEWTYACAAMTTSRRFYGYSDSLADHYFLHYDTSVDADRNVRYFPAATKMPNDFGMYAMYDGVREWGHDKTDKNHRRILGYSSGGERHVPTTFRDPTPSDLPHSRNGFYGLRIARTVVIEP